MLKKKLCLTYKIMGQNYKDKNMLKFHPFYDDQIEKDEIDDTPSNAQLLEELPFLSEKPKKIFNKELSQTLPFHPKKIKSLRENK